MRDTAGCARRAWSPRQSRLDRRPPATRCGRRPRSARSPPTRREPAGRLRPRLQRGAALARLVLDAAEHERGPPGLMAGPDAAAVVSVEILVKQHQVLPMGIGGEAHVLPMARP